MKEDVVRFWARSAVAFGLLLNVTVAAGAYDVTTIDLGRGPVSVAVPDGYSSDTPVPLIMLLHGYTSSGPLQENYMRFLPLVDRENFVYLYPNGTRDRFSSRFWNATRACCDFDESQADDSGYLRALINELTTIFSIDPEKIFIVGHSNGGFMAHRMACDHSDVVAGIASFAGAAFLDPSDCRPQNPVHLLQIHGTGDLAVLYNGGWFVPSRRYPGADASVQQWITHNQCSPDVDDSRPPLDLVAEISGAETTIERYRTGCLEGGSSELWTINGGTHVPDFGPRFGQAVVSYFLHGEAVIPPAPRVRRSRGRVPAGRTN